MANGSLRKGKFMVIILIIALFTFGNIASAAKMKISAQQAEEIKTVLGITQTFLNISKLIFNDNNWATVLNKAISVGQTGTDATYGLLVLSALNEMDLMDLVLSQRYKTEARDYFNKVLDERANLLSYWKGVGFDIPRVASGYITGPIAGLTLNSFAITDKAIAIFGEFYILEKMKLYDGLWYYFDLRKQGNEPHEIAWDETKMVIGFGSNSIGFHRASNRENELAQLEAQFLALWDKWGPYATPYGISEKYKEQARSELRNTLVTALEAQSFAQAAEETKPSLLDRLVSQFIKLKDMAAALMNQINPFKAGPIVDLSRLELEIIAEAEPSKIQEIEITKNSSSLIENLTEDSPPETLEPKEVQEEPQPQPQPEPAPVPAPTPEPEDLSGIASPTIELCQKKPGDLPRQYRVLINEVAWMGTSNSANDEWIELRNIWGIPVNLGGWQLLDKDQQIKIIFSKEDIIPVNGFYLLERTDDETVPNLKADLIYTGALNNNNEALYLFNNECQLEDKVLAEPDWPAGNNTEKKTMERFDAVNWYTGIINGTPKSENSSPSSPPAVAVPPPTSSSSASPPASAPKPTPKILITEVQIDHISSFSYDFIELYNSNTENVDISDFQLKKRSSTGSESSVRVFPEGSIIPTKGYFLWANSNYVASGLILADATSTQTLAENNSLAILDKNKNIIDALAWGSSTNPFVEGQPFLENPGETESLGRRWSTTTQSYIDTDDNSADFEIQTPTPKARNSQPLTEEPQEGVSLLSVVINEIAWMGTEANSADEWIEFYNNTNQEIDIANWSIYGANTGECLNFSEADGTSTTIIFPHGYLIYANHQDDLRYSNQSSMVDIWDATIGLNNNSPGQLILYDDLNCQGETIDIANQVSGDWFVGESENKISMERINSNTSGTDPENWASNNRITRNGEDAGGNKINGTPEAENSVSKSFTEISGGLNVNQDFTFTKLGSPYLIWGTINVSSGVTLSIEPGTILKFKKWDYSPSGVDIHGTLLAGENGEEPVVFTSIYDKDYATELSPDENLNPSPGDWHWLYFTSSTGSKLENVIVRYSGGYWGKDIPYNRGAVQVEGEEITIKDSIIENSLTQGLWFKNSSGIVENVDFLNNPTSTAVFIEGENSNPTITSSTFTGNNIGILIESSASLVIENNVFENNQTPIKTNTLLASFYGNTAQNNNLNGILVSGLGFSDTVNQVDWQKADLPYILESSATIASGKTLDIQPGVTVKLKSGGRIYVNGTLRAEGTENEKITFTSLIQTSAGAWDFISFSASSTNSILDNVIVRYGGWYNVFQGGENAKSGAIKADGVALALKNSLIENNLFAGLHLVNSTSTIENTTFKDHTAKYGQLGLSDSAAIYLENSTTTLDNVTFVNNSINIFP